MLLWTLLCLWGAYVLIFVEYTPRSKITVSYGGHVFSSNRYWKTDALHLDCSGSVSCAHFTYVSSVISHISSLEAQKLQASHRLGMGHCIISWYTKWPLKASAWNISFLSSLCREGVSLISFHWNSGSGEWWARELLVIKRASGDWHFLSYLDVLSLLDLLTCSCPRRVKIRKEVWEEIRFGHVKPGRKFVFPDRYRKWILPIPIHSRIGTMDQSWSGRLAVPGACTTEEYSLRPSAGRYGWISQGTTKPRQVTWDKFLISELVGHWLSIPCLWAASMISTDDREKGNISITWSVP